MKGQRAHKSRFALPLSLNSAILRDIGGILSRVSPDITYLSDHILTKYVSDETDSADVRRSRAINKWLETDSNNGTTNMNLMFLEDSDFIGPYESNRFLSVCRRFVFDVLGPVPKDILYGCFSGGSSTSRSRSESLPELKYEGQVDVTRGCLRRFISEAPDYCHWYPLRNFKLSNGAHMFTVPKKTDIDRVACKEPDLNMWCQKGVGSFIRKRLLRSGINLNDQSINGMLAKKGSKDGSLATLDLSSASDSITIEIVRKLLPHEWFSLLDDIRSPSVLIDGEWYETHMFSSMGNGFTFELESLIFLAITRAVAYLEGIRGSISVYGDDIICPTGIYSILVDVLSACGFTVNLDKSFFEGPIRESCGYHWWNGFDIKPFFIRRPVSTLPDLIRLLNQIRKWSSRDGMIDTRFSHFWKKYAKYVPSALYGGQDLESSDSLVTGHMPRKRLVPISRSRSGSEYGRYMQSLRSADTGSFAQVCAPTYVDALFRFRKNASLVNRDVVGYQSW